MCKSKDAVIASYHWAVLHTPVDTRAMYYVSSLLPLFVSRTFRYGRGERQDCEKKDCKGNRVGVFQWLARLARLARTFGSLARTLATLAKIHGPFSRPTPVSQPFLPTSPLLLRHSIIIRGPGPRSIPGPHPPQKKNWVLQQLLKVVLTSYLTLS